MHHSDLRLNLSGAQDSWEQNINSKVSSTRSKSNVLATRTNSDVLSTQSKYTNQSKCSVCVNQFLFFCWNTRTQYAYPCTCSEYMGQQFCSGYGQEQCILLVFHFIGFLAKWDSIMFSFAGWRSAFFSFVLFSFILLPQTKIQFVKKSIPQRRKFKFAKQTIPQRRKFTRPTTLCSVIQPTSPRRNMSCVPL